MTSMEYFAALTAYTLIGASCAYALGKRFSLIESIIGGLFWPVRFLTQVGLWTGNKR